MRIAGMLLAAGLVLAVQAAAAPPPVEAFGKIPEVGEIALSPNGQYVAWEDNRTDRPAVIVFDLLGARQKSAFPIDQGIKLRSVTFADDETLLITLSMTQTLKFEFTREHTNEWFRTLAVDINTGANRVLLLDETDLVTGASLLAARTDKPHTVTMARWTYEATAGRSGAGTRLAGKRKDSKWIYAVYAVDTRTGRGTRIAAGSQFTEQWVLDRSGMPVARGEWEPEANRYRILAKDGGGWRVIHTQTDGERIGLDSVTTEDSKAVLVLGALGEPRRKLWAIPLDGSGPKVLVDDPQREVLWVNHDRLENRPIAVGLGGITESTLWLDPKAEARHKSVSKAFPGRETWVLGRSEDYNRVLAMVESPSHPPIYYLVDFKTGRADIVGEAHPGLAQAKLGEVRTINYEARDGYAVPAYLTLPAGAGEKNLPLVVLPHGGPEARDYFEFDWWAQFLASRGYAVLQPQFRGSTGFGEEHRRAGYRQWGGLMQDDVTDGVKAMIDQGLADPRRVCIVGASYGGYAALAGAAFTPELYACAASINGVSDLPAMLAREENERGKESDAVQYWQDHIGLRTDPRVIEKSPARAAAAVKAPVLLIHGADDTVVPIYQSQKMYDALMALNRPVKLVKLPGEDHWLSTSATRIRMLHELETFLAQHLAPGTATAAAAQ